MAEKWDMKFTCYSCGQEFKSSVDLNDHILNEHKEKAFKGLSAPAAGEDPLSQPKRKTGRSVGEEQNVMGKSVSQDPFAHKSLSSAVQELKNEYVRGDGISVGSLKQIAQLNGTSYSEVRDAAEKMGLEIVSEKSAQKSADDEAPFIMEGEAGDDSPFYVIYAEGTKSQGFESKAEAQAFLDSVKGKSSKSISKSSKADRIMSIDNSILSRHGKKSGVALGEEPLRSEFLQEARGVGKLSAEDSAELEYENFHTALDILMREGLAERPATKSVKKGLERGSVCPKCGEGKMRFVEGISTESSHQYTGDASGFLECPKCGYAYLGAEKSSVSAEDENVKKGEPEKSEVVKWSWSDGVETCEFCGKDTPKLYSVNGKMMCAECKDGEKE